MSDDRFDELAKAAASTTSRRRALKIFGGALGGLFLSGGLFAKAHAAGNDCLPTGSRCKVNGDCCKTLAGSQCCCRSSKKTELLFGVCADRDACLAIGGVCK